MNGKGRGTSYYWIAAFTNEVGFHVSQPFLPQLVPALPATIPITAG